MSTATEIKEPSNATGVPAQAKKPVEPFLGPTRYDRVTSFLMSLIMLCTVAAASLGVIWASNRTWIVRRAPRPVEVLEVIEDVEGGGSEEGILDESLYAPGPQAPDVSTASNLDDVISDSQTMEQTVTTVLTAVGAAIDMSEQLMMETDIGSSALPGGNPKGKGRFRNLGKGPGDGGGVKRQERWEILFDAGQTEDEYAHQLDYFKVELGAIVDKKMYMVSNISRPKPDVRVTAGGPDEKRLYFSWRSAGRRQIDLNLLRKAGVPLAGSFIVLQFYPSDTEQHLARIELSYAQASGKAMHEGRLRMEKVRKTKFSVVKKGAGYDFQIAKQEYFGQPASK